MVKTIFTGLLLLAAAFIGLTSSGMPAYVASHFNAAGEANAHMSRTVYTAVMLVMGVGLPLMTGAIASSVYRKQGDRIRLPNKEFWLAPARREATLDFLVNHTRWFGCFLAAFLCYGHWLVVRANQQVPPRLDSSAFTAGLIAFFLCVAVWAAALFLRFRRV